LKKIARLPSKDRGEALKVLGRCVRRRITGDQANSSNAASYQASSDVSSASGTSDNDWRNWLVVHGNDQLAMEDVGGIGQSIGLRSGGAKRICSVLYPGRPKVRWRAQDVCRGRDCGRRRVVSFEVVL
jgi:hypothetical protein